MAESIESREAKHGSKMIEVKVRFWTNDLADGRDRIRPKHAWGSGVIRMARNGSHGIEPLPPIMFNSLAEIPAKIEKDTHRPRRHDSQERPHEEVHAVTDEIWSAQ